MVYILNPENFNLALFESFVFFNWYISYLHKNMWLPISVQVNPPLNSAFRKQSFQDNYVPWNIVQTMARDYLRNDVMQVVSAIALICLSGEIYMRNLFIYANHEFMSFENLLCSNGIEALTSLPRALGYFQCSGSGEFDL